jgi:hypothetical protein
MLASPVPEAEIPISALYDPRGLDLYHCLGVENKGMFSGPLFAGTPTDGKPFGRNVPRVQRWTVELGA